MLLGQMMPGMEFIPLILLAIVVGFGLGLLAILLALLRHLVLSRYVANLSIGVGVGATAIFIYLLGNNFGHVGYLFILFPAMLGGIAHGIAWVEREKPPLKTTQVSLITILLLMTVAGVIMGFVKASHVPYYERRDAFLRNLEPMDEISNVVVDGFDSEESWYPSQISFSIAGRPDTLLVIYPQHELKSCRINEPIKRLYVFQLGPYRFSGHVETVEQDGRTSKSNPSSIELGTDGVFRDQLPCQIDSIQDLIEHYDELIVFFNEEWPRANDPGHLEVERETHFDHRPYLEKTENWLEPVPNLTTP